MTWYIPGRSLSTLALASPSSRPHFTDPSGSVSLNRSLGTGCPLLSINSISIHVFFGLGFAQYDDFFLGYPLLPPRHFFLQRSMFRGSRAAACGASAAFAFAEDAFHFTFRSCFRGADYELSRSNERRSLAENISGRDHGHAGRIGAPLKPEAKVLLLCRIRHATAKEQQGGHLIVQVKRGRRAGGGRAVWQGPAKAVLLFSSSKRQCRRQRYSR